MRAASASVRAIAARGGFSRAFGKMKLVSLIAAMIAATSAPAMANGGKAKTVRYTAEIPLGPASRGFCEFTVEIQPVMFYLTAVQNKYQAALIRVVNNTDRPLLLSKSRDRVELRLGDKTVPGELDLSEKDSALWDSLPLKIRQALAYPSKVDKGEEEGVFVFIPKDALKHFVADQPVPLGFAYSIDSIGKVVELHRLVAAAKK